MSDKVFFSLPCRPCVNLRLTRDRLTFFSEYCGRSVLTAKTVAQIGFDLCESACHEGGDIATRFQQLTGLVLDEQIINTSKYAPVETKVFGTLDENAAVYSLGVLLRELLISTGRSDSRLRAILDKACERYPFMRYEDFRALREDLAIYLKTEVEEEIYGVVITADKPLPEPIFRHNHTEKAPDEAVCFVPYSRVQRARHFAATKLTLPRIQIALAAFFILFSSISIPLTSLSRAHDIPTLAYYENQNK